jgi:hypothetical protein
MNLKDDKKPFYIIIKRGDRRNHRHFSEESALKEAERLSNTLGDKFYVAKTYLKSFPDEV